jgi:hypothetical protein
MKSIATWIAFAMALAVGVHLAFHVPLGWSMVGFLVAWPVAGTVITIDDSLPGGWSNPDGKAPQMWSYGQFWGQLTLRAALSLIGFAVDNGSTNPQSIPYWVAAFTGSALGVTMILKWPYPKNDG